MFLWGDFMPATITHAYFAKDYTVLRRDIDINNHMHNLNYLDMAYDILPEDISKKLDLGLVKTFSQSVDSLKFYNLFSLHSGKKIRKFQGYFHHNQSQEFFINLLKNSIEAIKDDGCINVATHILKGYYYIEITDNGCGMAKVDLERVKEMFFTTKVSGNGLGVSLANEIVRLHNGFLNYYSKEGIGTRVVVKLPIVVL